MISALSDSLIGHRALDGWRGRGRPRPQPMSFGAAHGNVVGWDDCNLSSDKLLPK